MNLMEVTILLLGNVDHFLIEFAIKSILHMTFFLCLGLQLHKEVGCCTVKLQVEDHVLITGISEFFIKCHSYYQECVGGVSLCRIELYSVTLHIIACEIYKG